MRDRGAAAQTAARSSRCGCCAGAPRAQARSSVHLSQARLSEDGVCLRVGSAEPEADAQPDRERSSLEQEHGDDDTGPEPEPGLHNGVGQRCVPRRVHDGCRRLWLVGLFNGYCRHAVRVCVCVCWRGCAAQNHSTGVLCPSAACSCLFSCAHLLCPSFLLPLSSCPPAPHLLPRFDTQTEQTPHSLPPAVHGCLPPFYADRPPLLWLTRPRGRPIRSRAASAMERGAVGVLWRADAGDGPTNKNS